MSKLQIFLKRNIRILTGILCVCSCSFSAFAQGEKRITGTVADVKGEAIIGVNVIEKGIANGSTTDVDGKFSLEVSPNATLVISYIGYNTQEVAVANQTHLTITLMENTALLDEVIIIGYGSTRKSDLTGSVSSLKASSLERRPASSIDALLQGKVAGLRITQSSGEPGASVSVRLRGISSRSGSNSPLYVVDGFPYGDAGNLKQINVNDIESIEVLKDASAASIYGSRGANGVIMITTKSGGIDKKPTVSASANVGVQQINTSNFALMSPYVAAMLSDEARINDSRFGVPQYIGNVDSDGFYYPSLTELSESTWDKTTDWKKELLRSAVVQNYNLSVSGGGKNNAYLFSGSYFSQEGTLIGSGYENLTGRFKFDQRVIPALKLGTNLSFSYVDRQPALIGYSALYRNPVFPVRNEDGSYYQENPTDFGNPVMLAREVKNHSDEYDVNISAYAEWNPLKELTVKGQTGIKYGASDTDQYYPRTTNVGDIWEGEANRYLTTNLYLLNEIYGTYKKTFAEVHDFSAMLGFVGEISHYQGINLTARGFPNDNLTNENLGLGAPDKNIITNGKSKEVLNSFISRINYTYDNRYLLTFTGRYDGSSKFGINNKYAFFPSLALGWKLSEEQFLKDRTTWLSDLKLRASYGSTGNQAITVYGTKDQVSGDINDKYYLGNALYAGMGVVQMGNKSLKWETTTQANIGLDLGVLKNALTLTVDVYDKESTGLLRQLNLPISGGIGDQHAGTGGKVWINSGEISNKGIEIGLNARIISQKDFSWSVNMNAAHNRSVVKNIGEEGESMGLLRSRGSFVDGGVYWRNGQPMDLIVGYRMDGIIQEGDVINYLSGDDARPGEFNYRNVNDDNQLSLADDGVVLGNAQPKWIGGIGTSLTYKGFDFDMQMNGVTGNKIISQQRFSYGKAINRWTVDNQTEKFPRLRNGRSTRLSDWWIENGDYLRISNITLGYSFNTAKMRGIDSFRIYLSCSNPYVFTKFSGIDPEVSTFDGGAYPKATSFTIGTSIQF